ncbi:hypothetical protein V5J35_001873 [Endozoicomonas sp. NE40]|uniref:Uncharacterized protein n=1 Tax=Endozoicomonas lisbonensis TaxID=3120522 RepID=A0ABV2SFY4_9GAMM
MVGIVWYGVVMLKVKQVFEIHSSSPHYLRESCYLKFLERKTASEGGPVAARR